MSKSLSRDSSKSVNSTVLSEYRSFSSREKFDLSISLVSTIFHLYISLFSIPHLSSTLPLTLLEAEALNQHFLTYTDKNLEVMTCISCGCLGITAVWRLYQGDFVMVFHDLAVVINGTNILSGPFFIAPSAWLSTWEVSSFFLNLTHIIKKFPNSLKKSESINSFCTLLQLLFFITFILFRLFIGTGFVTRWFAGIYLWPLITVGGVHRVQATIVFAGFIIANVLNWWWGLAIIKIFIGKVSRSQGKKVQ